MMKSLIALIIIQTYLFAYTGFVGGFTPSLAFFIIAIASFIDSIRQLIKKEYLWALLEFLFGMIMLIITVVEGKKLIVKLFF